MTKREQALRDFQEWCRQEKARLFRAREHMQRPTVVFTEDGVSIKQQEIEKLTHQMSSLESVINDIERLLSK